MGWLASLLVGALTALSGMILAGLVANAAVGWYRISSFEGGSGYYVVGIAMLGLAGGLIIGVVTSRIVAAGAAPGFLKAFSLSQAVLVLLVGAIGGWFRLMADVPPKLDGEELLLAVELRWPAGQALPEPSRSDWRVRLSSSIGHRVRASSTGPLWREDARLEDGRWIVPGAVSVFTSRGERVIGAVPDDMVGHVFSVPLPGRPGTKQREWSDWLPHAPNGRPPLPEGFRYRFRVVPTSRPVRTETFGPFEIATVAASFWESGDERGDGIRWNAGAQFIIRHRGQTVSIGSEADRVFWVGALGAGSNALIAHAGDWQSDGACYLIADEAPAARVSRIADCHSPLQPRPLTDDDSIFRHALDATPQGRFDRTSFVNADAYFFPGALLDARSLAVRHFDDDEQGRIIERIPPLSLSPDGSSFVRLAWTQDSDEDVALVVTNVETGASDELAVDRAHMRYANIDQLDPGWLQHYFAWQRHKGGPDRLAARADAVPRPHRGTLTNDGTGYREYGLQPGGDALRTAFIDFLVTDFGAERLPIEGEGGYAQDVRLDRDVIHVGYDAREHRIGVWMDRGTDSGPVALIAERFDAALRSGKYDRFFGAERQ